MAAMKAIVGFGLVLLGAFALTLGRAQVRPQRIAVLQPKPPATNSVAGTNAASLDGKWHSVIRRPSPKLPKIHWYNKLNPIWWFKNADEPKPPAWFRPGEKRRQFKWFLRNPFHNLTHYVIGIADKKYVRSGRYPEKVSNPNGGWNFAIARRGIVFLPYLSYRRGKFEFYFGWRVLGNFGIKINVNPARTHPLPGEKPAPRTPAGTNAPVVPKP